VASSSRIFNLTRIQENGESRTSRGKFFVVTVKDTDGTWRFQADGYNNLPKPK
jgi:ketosteroid isomerase-like protein